MAGVSHVFSEKMNILVKSLDDFQSAWQLLLKHIEIPALSRNCEVSLNALNCFQEILNCNKQMIIRNLKEQDKEISISITDEQLNENRFKLELNTIPDDKTIELWKIACKTWFNIGTECFNRNSNNCSNPNLNKNKVEESTTALNEYYTPSQAFLSSLIQIFPRLYENIKYDFTIDDFSKLSAVLENAVAVPIDLSTQAYLMSASVQTTNNFEYLAQQNSNQQQSQNNLITKSTNYQCTTGHSSNCSAILNQQQCLISQTSQQLIPLTPLQEAILCIMELFQTDLFAQLSSTMNKTNNSLSNNLESENLELKNADELLTCLFSQLLTFATYACQPPTLNQTSGLTNGNYNLGKSLLISSNSLLNKYQSSSSVSLNFLSNCNNFFIAIT